MHHQASLRTVEKCRLAVTVQRIVPLRFKNSTQAAELFRGIWSSLACQRLMAYNSASAHHSYTIRILAVCTFLHAVQLFFSEKKLTFSLLAGCIVHTRVLDYVIQQYKSPNLNFANIAVFSPFRQINARQILPLYSISWETSESVNCVLDSMNTSSASYRHFPGIQMYMHQTFLHTTHQPHY